MPQAKEAEMAVLGAFLLSPRLIAGYRDELRPGHLFLESNKAIYRAMLVMANQGVEIDAITLVEILKARNELQLAGGAAYLGQLVDYGVNARLVDEYVKLIKAKSRLREIIRRCEQFQTMALEQEREPDAIVDAIGAWLNTARAGMDEGFVTNRDLGDRIFQQIAEAKSASKLITGLRTGLGNLDDAINGIEDGCLYTLAGYSSLGKTTLALQWAENFVQTGGPNGEKVVVIYFTLEMTPERLFKKMLSKRTRIGVRRLSQGYFPDEQLADVADAVDALKAIEFAYVADIADSRAVRQKIDRIRAKYPAGTRYVVIVDTLQLMAANGQDEFKEVARASREMKRITIDPDYGMPIIQLSQITVANDYDLSKEPHEGLLRGAKSIYHDSDCVMFLHCPSGDTNDPEREIIKRKDRDGVRVEKFPCLFIGSRQQFMEVNAQPNYDSSPQPNENAKPTDGNLFSQEPDSPAEIPDSANATGTDQPF